MMWLYITIYISVIHGTFDLYRYKDIIRNKYMDKIILLTDKEKLKFNFSNISIIPHFTNITRKTTNHSQKNILSVGRFVKNDIKGFLRLVDIWDIVQKNKKYNDWTLTIIGEGENKINIERKIKSKNLKNIILKSFTKNIEKEYLSASIYTMCSYREGFGMVLIESASYGLPSLAFDINNGPSDIIKNEKSGFLISDGDLDEFANKLCILMDDVNLRKIMGLNAKEKVKKEFGKEVIMEKWKQVFNE